MRNYQECLLEEESGFSTVWPAHSCFSRVFSRESQSICLPRVSMPSCNHAVHDNVVKNSATAQTANRRLVIINSKQWEKLECNKSSTSYIYSKLTRHASFIAVPSSPSRGRKMLELFIDQQSYEPR